MPRTAKVFMTNRGQAVRLPPEYQRDWASYLESAPVASDTFMTDVEDLPVQES
jgi:virulence-associated protein VagC